MAAKRYRLAQRRKTVGYTQEQLAEQLGVDRTTIIRWEAGDTEPQPWQWPNLADALNISAEKLTELLCSPIPIYPDNAHHTLSVASDTPATPTGSIALSRPTETLLLDFLGHQTAANSTAPRPALPDTAMLGVRLPEIDIDELVQMLMMWAQHLDPNISRREVLAKLSAAFSLAAAAPLFDIADPSERDHVRRAIAEPSSFSEPAMRYCGQMVGNLRRQGDMLGPQNSFQSALAHRQLAAAQAKVAPPGKRAAVLSVYAELNQLLGWFCYNLGDYHSALCVRSSHHGQARPPPSRRRCTLAISPRIGSQ